MYHNISCYNSGVSIKKEATVHKSNLKQTNSVEKAEETMIVMRRFYSLLGLGKIIKRM